MLPYIEQQTLANAYNYSLINWVADNAHGRRDGPERPLVPQRRLDRRLAGPLRGLGLGRLDPDPDLHQLRGQHGDVLQGPDLDHIAGAASGRAEPGQRPVLLSRLARRGTRRCRPTRSPR